MSLRSWCNTNLRSRTYRLSTAQYRRLAAVQVCLGRAAVHDVNLFAALNVSLVSHVHEQDAEHVDHERPCRLTEEAAGMVSDSHLMGDSDDTPAGAHHRCDRRFGALPVHVDVHLGLEHLYLVDV
jgi:hypothetical protein